jgi:hypothetical protein
VVARGERRGGREATWWAAAIRVVFNLEPGARSTMPDGEEALSGARGLWPRRRRKEESGRKEGVASSPRVTPASLMARSSSGADNDDRCVTATAKARATTRAC